MFKGLRSLITGILTGTLLGILFAPKKGKELREEFKEDFKEGGIGIGTIKENASEMGKDISSSYKECCGGITEDARFKKGVEKAKEYGEKAKNEAEELYKKHVPSKNRKKIKNVISKAKKTIGETIKKIDNRDNKK